MSHNKKKLNETQIAMLKAMSQWRVPVEAIASALSISPDTLIRMAKRDKAVAAALDSGRAAGTAKVYQTAFQLATGYKRARDVFNSHGQKIETVYEDVPPDPNMTRFWLKTQERWRETDRLEISGPGGGPIAINEMTPAQRDERIAFLDRLQDRLNGVPVLIGSDVEGDGPEGEEDDFAQKV